MLRGILDWFTTRVGGDETDGDETEDARFVPSPLDVSVRFAHGMRSDGVEREIADIEEKAQTLEQQRRGE